MIYKINIKPLLAVIIVLALIICGAYFFRPSDTHASVSQGSSYKSVVTATALQNSGALNTTAGTLGSVVITGAAAGTFELYDATTTDVTKRAASLATSTLRRLASFPTNAAVGTYTFDSEYYFGLVVAFTSTQGTTTITYR